jgi:hypothetical protein
MWPQLGRAQVDEVVTAVASFYQDRGRARGQAGGRAAGGQGVH